MRKYPHLLLAMFIALQASAQHMQVKRHNYTVFTKDVKQVSPLLEKNSTPQDKQHPEYGIVPFNAYCQGCTELIDRRTVDSRYYISPDTPGKFFVQKSYFPLHYKKSANDIWRTIDYRLRPVDGEQGIYEAPNQPAPTRCDLNRKSTSFLLGKTNFEFNHDLTLYFFDEDKAYLKPEKGNYADYTIGDEGLVVKNMWPGIDMEQTFRSGEIETDYVINKPLQLPIDAGYMVVEDHFTLPEGWTITEASTGAKLDNGYFSGDYKIGDGKGTEVVYHRPAYYDAKAIGMMGMYNLKKNGNDCTLQMMVPVKWLNNASNTYPLYVDPIVAPDSNWCNTILGNYQSTGLPPFQYAFTDKRYGSCNDTIGVPTPPRTTVAEAYVALEYQLTYSPTCGTPGNYEAAPYCAFNQISQQVINNNCGTTSGVFQCNPASAPYTGTCTTDSDLVAGAHPLRINNFAPNFLSCLTPVCNPDTVYFTLENQDSTCDDQCGYLCARGHLYSMILVGYFLTSADSINGYPDTVTNISVCQGQTVSFTAQGAYGVPPYTCLWSIDGGVTYDTTSSQFQFVATNPSGYSVNCVVTDLCGDISANQVDVVNIISSPITVSGDTLIAPHSDNGYQWYLNGNPIAGATSQTFIETQLGLYSVSYSDTTTGCDSSASSIDLTAIPNIVSSGIEVYPNPSSGAWELSVGNNMIGNTVQIYNALGQVVYSAVIRNTKTAIAPTLAAGVYQLRILDKNNRAVYQEKVERAGN